MSDEIINKPKFNFSEFFNKNKKKLILIVVTAILIVFALIIFNEFKKKQFIEISEKYNSAKILIENKNPNEALKILEDLILKKNKFYSPSALNLIIDKELINDNKKKSYHFLTKLFQITN